MYVCSYVCLYVLYVAIANCHKNNEETERSWYLQEWPNVVQCKRQGRQRQRQCHCQLNSVKELSLCYLQSCRSCVGSLVWLPLCKDIAVATCWSGASAKLCQTVIAFLWLTFNCSSPSPCCVCVCLCGRSWGAAMLSAVTYMYRYMSFYNFLNAAVLWLDASAHSVKFNADKAARNID